MVAPVTENPTYKDSLIQNIESEITSLKTRMSQLENNNKTEITELRDHGDYLAGRIDTLNQMVNNPSTPNTPHQAKFSKEGVKKGLEFLKKTIWKFRGLDYVQHYNDKVWNEEKHKLVKDAVDYYFKQGTESTATKKKAVKEFYEWFTTKDGLAWVHGFDLDATDKIGFIPIPGNEKNQSVRQYLNYARKQYQDAIAIVKQGKTFDWKHTPWFTPPEMWVKMYGNYGVSKHRVTEAWKKAVIHHTESEAYYKKKPKDYSNEKIQNHTFIYGSNMPTDNYDLVFD